MPVHLPLQFAVILGYLGQPALDVGYDALIEREQGLESVSADHELAAEQLGVALAVPPLGSPNDAPNPLAPRARTYLQKLWVPLGQQIDHLPEP